ncbi:MAG: branched-chain amino acid ABC transporter permease [Nitrospirae bacterium]|nr:branched-chain amino acid ABC transporter permease [Nitrospirota bacterium]
MTILKGKRSLLMMTLVIPLWLSFLFLPFKGIRAAGILFVVMAAAIPLSKLAADLIGRIRSPFPDLRRFVPEGARLNFLLLIPALLIPLFGQDYITDVAILSGIYIILALGLNVVVGFTGLLNLGFVAFYAIGAYCYALLNTKAGIGFWSAMPLSVVLTTAAGFLLAVPALRLKGDYLALVTLGFGEIVRLVLNNWDTFTNGPNGISGIAPPFLAGTPIGRLSWFYYLVLIFVIINAFVMKRVRSSKTGRAWMAIREDEIAASAMGINTLMYKLYACAFGAFWAGLAGTLFAAKMRFVSPESFTFMESVFILCMVIIGGIGSIGGVVVGALVLVFLPEVLREVQMYRMLALGCGLVFLMVFRPQGLFGGRNASSSR